jgi:hypothetical protein
MITIDEMQEILDQLAEELPPVFYHELNGGILLLPEAKPSPYAQRGGDLWILGEYTRSYTMGKYIKIFYGSFEKIFGNLPVEQLTVELRKTLRHEFRHHLEGLAGEDGLEREDAEFITKYLAGF